jgi:sodium-dependent dicarboxylate transporter 2/3/5
MNGINYKLYGFIFGLFLFLLIIVAPIPKTMIYIGSKIVLSHSNKQVLRKIGIKKVSVIKKGELPLLLEKSKNIFVKIPKNFSKSGYKGIKLSKEKGKKLSELFYIQAKAIKITLAIAVLMAIFWITEAIPIPITSLFPLLFFPVFNISNLKYISFPGFFNPAHLYMHYLIILFLAGFTIAEAMKKWNLHRRISLFFLCRTDFTPYKIIFSFMMITAFLSMFISNTATTAMMLPIGLGIIATATDNRDKSNFGKVLMLGIAYAASIGGVGTLIGTPPNVVLAGFADTLLGIKITFGNWLLIGLPITFVMLPITFIILIKLFPIEKIDVKDAKEQIQSELKKLGKLSIGERNTLIIFIIVALLWIFEKNIKNLLHLPWVNDAVVGVLAILLFYVIPVSFKKGEFTLDWSSNKKLPWGTLLLFGGGLALGTGLDKTGAASYIAQSLTLFNSVSFLILLLSAVFLMVFLTEITSNTASTNMMLPILFSIGLTTAHNPIVLMTAGAIGASMAFMLPVATPPNALVFGSGYIRIKDMMRAGIFLNFVSIVLITVLLYFYRLYIPIFIK